ncbi:4'-phosphopantetheinyl transferase family protein [Sinomonas humi]|uniref:4'-phosphopantetheinyl transferase family protein n=1 Tax=Sinomonas humi TaxID=1338436 RepID=UPI0012DFEFF5|nr:4'-phosphopantetheinyl transferase superfamily protein [Sinomonas humi]
MPLGGADLPWPTGEPTAGEAQRARAMADRDKAREFTLARLALRGLVASVLGLPPQVILPAYECPDCGQGEHGSPGFALYRDHGGQVGLPIAASASRAGGWALLAVAPADDGERVRLGVDLAAVADLRNAVPEAAFSRAERRRLSQVPDRGAEAARLWARKEALLKARGEGLRTDPATVETLDNPSIADLSTSGLGLPGGFVAALAVVKP